MKYLISSYGHDLAVGLLDPETAEIDINLSHNLFNTNVNYNYYNGVLNFNTLSKFYRYLINKHYLLLWEKDKTFREVLSEAKDEARKVLNTEVGYRNFMPEIYQKSRSYQVYTVSS
jgi:hypothetical protein